MATIEKLFVQLFDRKRSIIDNLRQQQQLYYQHLVSKCLIIGISPPPPSVFTPNFSDDFSALNKEELISELLLPQPRPLVSYPNSLPFFHDKPVGEAVENGLPNEFHSTTCASSNGDDEVDEIAPQLTVDGPKKDSSTFPPSHVDGTEDIPSYILMSPEDQIDTVISSAYSKAEESLARIQRSRSRQKALELRNSGKTSGKSCLGREGDNHSRSKETRMNDQQLVDLRESVELAEPLVLSSKTCTKEVATVEDCAHDIRGSDTGCSSHSQTRGHETREVQMGDDEMTEKSNDHRMLAESRSFYSLAIVGDSLENDKMASWRNREKKQVNTDDLQSGRVTKSSSDYMHSINEEQAIRTTEAYCGRVTRSRSHQNHSKSQEVFTVRTTRSRNGNAEQPQVHVVQNENVVRSRKRSISEHLANGNSKACSGKITRSRSMHNELEAGYHRSWSKNGLSVLPKQLDFDDAEETCLADIQLGGQSISEEMSLSPEVQENFASLPFSMTIERSAKSFSGEKLEGCSRDNAQISPNVDSILGKNSVSGDCPADSQVMDEQERDNSSEFDKDASLYSEQKHTIDPEGDQTHSEEAATFGLMDTHTDKTINLHRETSGASESLLKIQCELNSGKSSQDQAVECVHSSPNKASAEFLPAITSNDSKSEYAPNMRVDCQSTTGGVETSCVSNYVGSVGSKLEKIPSGLNVLPDYSYESVIDGSYPCYKRRKIGYQPNSKSASPSVRLNPVSAVNKSVQRKSSENSQGARTTLSDGLQLTLNVQHDEGNLGLEGSAMELFRSNNTRPSISCVSKVKTAESSDSFSDKRIAPVEPISAIHCSTRKWDYLDPSKDVKGNVGLGGSATGLVISDNTQSSISCVSKVKTAEPSESFSDKRKVPPVEPISAIHYTTSKCDDFDPAKDVTDGYSKEKIDFTEISVDQKQSLQGVGKLKFSFGSPPVTERMDVSLSDDGDMPVYESFTVSDPRECVQNDRDEIIQDTNSYLSTTTDGTSFLGQICQSTGLSTPSSPFPAGCKFHQMPGVYHSIPNRFLENIYLGSNELVGGSALRAKSYSGYSFPNIRPEWDTLKPYISPIGKGFEGITSKSGGSGQQVSGNAELVCFPIKEDPESSDEELNVNDVVGTTTNEVDSATRNHDITSNNQGTMGPTQVVLRSIADSSRSEIDVNDVVGTITNEVDSATRNHDITSNNQGSMDPTQVVPRSSADSARSEIDVKDVVGTITNEVDSTTRKHSTREPLHDITSNNEGTVDPDQAVLISSTDSVNAIPSKDCKKNEVRQSNRLRKPGKENHSLSIGANSLRKQFESLGSRNSKPTLLGKSSLRSTGQRLSEKEPKRNNIVSNVKSFIPIVQQKQAAAALPAKREVKVKALEAAEAAKRLAEKRENERKQKKEAMKLERSRLEQENMKQMELKKKLQEKEKKRRDAENAEKKRQREEEEKKEKERKRRRIEDARGQQQRAEEKLNAYRDTNDRKESQDNGVKEQNGLKKSANDLVQNGKIDVAEVIMNGNKASTGSSDTVQVAFQAGNIEVAEISTPNVEKEVQFARQTYREPSYAISPYQGSDDEEDEEDEVRVKKFIPSWASKSNIEVALSSLEQLNADSIFPPEILCSLEEVLLPRRLNPKKTTG